MSKELRYFQSEAHEASISRYNAGVDSQLIVIMTGGGKTYLTVKLLERYGFKRVLWLSFQEELVSQSGMAFIKEKFDDRFYNHVNEKGFLNYIREGGLFALKDFKLGCVKADIFKPDASVVMGSVQTVVKRLHLLPSDYFDCIVADEAHLYMSASAMKVCSHFKPKLLLGLTASPYRADGVSLGDLFKEIVYEYGLDRGVKDGFAAELDAIKIKTNCSLDKVRTTAGDFNQKDLADEINTLARNQLIVDSYKKYAEGRQTIAFCVDIAHAIELAEVFKRNGYNCEAVSSDEEKTPERSEKIKKFKEGKIDILTNVGILVLGFDHPDTGCAIMASPTKSLTKYIQSVGRIARVKSEEYVKKFKQTAIILDITDVTTRHNLINAWSLDKEKPIEDRVFVSGEKKQKLLEERAKRNAKLQHERKDDERVKLLSLPKFKIIKSQRMQESATEAQLEKLKGLGYDIENVVYTKAMCSEIISQLPATEAQIWRLKKLNYDCSGVVTFGVASQVINDWKYKLEKHK